MARRRATSFSGGLLCATISVVMEPGWWNGSSRLQARMLSLAFSQMRGKKIDEMSRLPRVIALLKWLFPLYREWMINLGAGFLPSCLTFPQ